MLTSRTYGRTHFERVDYLHRVFLLELSLLLVSRVLHDSVQLFTGWPMVQLLKQILLFHNI